MCGIAGFLDPGASTTQQSATGQLQRMQRALRHRGPDDQGLWYDLAKGVGFAHTRLAVIDLSAAGRQPMQSGSGRFVICYNGEIYNFRDIGKRLRAGGFVPRGSSDTEILVEAIDRLGLEQTLSLLNGMFAFALWDRHDGKLHIVRDPIGEKPLYYGWLGGKFVFASELAAIRQNSDWNAAIDLDAVALYMRYAYIPAPYSIYEGIYKLMPGCVLTVAANARGAVTDFSPYPESAATSPKRYWHLKTVSETGLKDSETRAATAIETLESLLTNAVRRQMVADVPVGAFLSGGIDSSTVVALMQNCAAKPVKTFSIGYDDPEFDESGYAKDVARHLGTEHHELHLSASEAMAVIPRLSSVYDEPHADASNLSTLLVSSLAREAVTVCMSGDGGDELFLGYNRYLHSDSIWRILRHLPALLRPMASRGLSLLSPGAWDAVFRFFPGRPPRMGYKLQKLSDALNARDLTDVYRRLISYWPSPQAVVPGSREPVAFFAESERLGEPASFMEQMAYWDQLAYLPDDNLAKVDRASMSVSLETRAPLLDKQVIEYSWRVNRTLKVRQKKSKWLLRQILYRHVPASLVERPKMGFSVPVGQWLRGPLREWAGDLLSAASLNRHGYLDPEPLQRIWNAHAQGHREYQNQLWAALMLQSWLDSLDAARPA